MASPHPIPLRRDVLERLHQQHECRPHPSEPGTLAEQLAAIDLYLDDPTRRDDPAGAWAIARRLAIPHARRRD